MQSGKGQSTKCGAGESVSFVITDYRAAVSSDLARSSEFIDGSWGYDAKRYTELLLRAVETILMPLGVNAKMLQDWLAKELPAASMPMRVRAREKRPYLGPLFEFALTGDARR